MREVISYIYNKGGILFPPASSKAVKFVNKILLSHNFSIIPEEYEEFLGHTDGMIWDGIELSGTRSEERKEKNYNFPGLIELNLDFMTIDVLRGFLVIGRGSEEIIAYDTRKEKFIVIDRLDLNPSAEFISFRAFLKNWVYPPK